MGIIYLTKVAKVNGSAVTMTVNVCSKRSESARRLNRNVISSRYASEGGKALSKPNLSEGQAKKRLQQVEYFKHMKAGQQKKAMGA